MSTGDPSVIKLFGCNISHSTIPAASNTEHHPSAAAATATPEIVKLLDICQEIRKDGDLKTQEGGVGQSNSSTEANVFSKPANIISCPRCNSMKTKFCYFNNYNVNQPRHFCRSCQRYWTAGGTIRNVSMGAGRRKNKHSVPSADSAVTHINLPISAGQSSAGLSRASEIQDGRDTHLSNSVATLLTFQEQNKSVQTSKSSCGGGVSSLPVPITIPSGSGSGSGSSPSVPTPMEKIGSPQVPLQTSQLGSSGSYVLNLPTPQGITDPSSAAYPWSFGWTGVAYDTNYCQTAVVPMVVSPTATSSGLSSQTTGVFFPFGPQSYVGLDTSASNFPSSSQLSRSSSVSSSSYSGTITSPSLGKHSRELNSQDEEPTGKCLWVPKTLRVDEPDEAAKTAFGIKTENDRSLFKD